MRKSSAATVAAGKNNKPGSVGIPMVNTLVSAFEPGTDKELPIGQRGELCISAASRLTSKRRSISAKMRASPPAPKNDGVPPPK